MQRTLDLREHDICRRVATRLSGILDGDAASIDPSTLAALRLTFDEQVISDHLTEHHSLDLSVQSVLAALHELSQQTYENKALTFGCILDPNWTLEGLGEPAFPRKFFRSKRFKALSDGFRTAYIVSTNGHVMDFVDLEQFEAPQGGSRKFFPEWAESLANACKNERCGIALSRQGDILVFDAGALRFAYRYGRWQYWNHDHLLHLLTYRARAQGASPGVVSKVVSSVYRAALDVAFRRSGGLFVLLRNRKRLREIVRQGDALDDPGRPDEGVEFDNVVRGRRIQGLPRSVLVELAALDGAVVLDNGGRILAYGAVLRQRSAGRGEEGSRTKAAVGASKFGLAVKISADGDITVYHESHEFIRV